MDYGKGRNGPVANNPCSAFLFRPHGPSFIGTAIPGFQFKNLRIPAPLLQKTGMHSHCPAGKTSLHARHVILSLRAGLSLRTLFTGRKQSLYILGQHIHFQIDRLAGNGILQIRAAESMGE